MSIPEANWGRKPLDIFHHTDLSMTDEEYAAYKEKLRMKWERPKSGSKRVKRRFAWFPTGLMRTHSHTGETVWLEWLEVLQHFVPNSYGGGYWSTYSIVRKGESFYNDEAIRMPTKRRRG